MPIAVRSYVTTGTVYPIHSMYVTAKEIALVVKMKLDVVVLVTAQQQAVLVLNNHQLHKV